MVAISTDTRIAQRRGVLSTQVGDELVLMSVEQGEYYGFDPVAAGVWARIAEPTTVGSLVETLAAAYEGDPATIAADVQALLEMLADKGLLELG